MRTTHDIVQAHNSALKQAFLIRVVSEIREEQGIPFGVLGLSNNISALLVEIENNKKKKKLKQEIRRLFNESFDPEEYQRKLDARK